MSRKFEINLCFRLVSSDRCALYNYALISSSIVIRFDLNNLSLSDWVCLKLARVSEIYKAFFHNVLQICVYYKMLAISVFKNS